MPSPAKKRKLNNDGKQPSIPSRGLDYFFSKQKQNGAVHQHSATDQADGVEDAKPDHELTDEELARKLQAQWDQEDAQRARDAADSTNQGVAPAQLETPESSGTNTERTTEPAKPREDAPVSALDGDKKGTLSLQSVAASVDTVSESIPFDESPLTFEPSKYVHLLRDHWNSEGGDASYALLTRCFILINGTTSRIKIVDTLVNCLRVLIEADPSSLLPAVSIPRSYC